MMKFKIFLLLLLVGSFSNGFSQVLKPAKWTYDVSSKDVKVGDEITLTFKATIEPNWYLYSSVFPCEDPMKWQSTFQQDKSYELIGGTIAVNPIDKHDKIFECDVKIFKEKAEFRQKVKVLSSPLKIAGTFDYQVCTELTGQCVPGEGEFSFDDIKVTGSELQVAGKHEKTKTQVTSSQSQQSNNKSQATNNKVQDSKDSTQHPTSSVQLPISINGPQLDVSLNKTDGSQSSFLGFFLLAFFAGLAALLTPCVFPMIPMTVSFFTGRGNKMQALIYGISIIAIYTIIGAVLAPLMGPETANHLSTEWIPNLIFFTVFIVFGLSFLGLFEITLPNAFVNKVDQQADKGGLLGLFFMAFTLVLISFSCTGPIVGSILVSSAGGEFLKPIVGMFAFSLAFAIPFTLFAFFPNWLKSLPKSGGWLNTVKVVLGFIEIALAFKFLSIAD